VEIAIVRKEDAAALRNLFQLYAHDFSEQVPLEIDADGRFGVTVGDEWWTSPGHHPFFLRAEGKLVGFALVRNGSRVTGDPSVKDVAEFFVIRGARRRGVGSRAAEALWSAFPGRWEVRVRRANSGGLAFWSRQLGGATEPFLDRGIDWVVFRFTTQR
jgi:predicted acetyltransferase